MGQKVNPIGMRLALSRDWRSRWYAGKQEFGSLLKEDVELRERVARNLTQIIRQRRQRIAIVAHRNTQVQHDLLQPRNLHPIFIAPTLHQLRDHTLFICFF